jgi:uncharacterized protein (TIGR00297 family)
MKLQSKRLLLGLLFSSAIGVLAERRGSLTKSGALGAVLTGTSIVGFGGLAWGATLLYFFGSSTLLSHFKEREKEAVAADKFSKGGRRDFWQALANGGVAMGAAIGYGLARRASRKTRLLAAFVGAMAAANADTWATEVGTLSSEKPRLLTTGQTVAPGTSGGVTLLGTGAALAGAASVGLVAEVLGASKHTPLRGRLPMLALLSGVAGALADSALGATVQAMYCCPRCQQETERHVHRCGEPTQRMRGLPWLENDAVNFASTAVGALVAVLLARR